MMSSILCETRIKRKRKKKYDAELQMNFRNGFLIACRKDHPFKHHINYDVIDQDEENENRSKESDVDL